jgi:hypothetical protein
MLLVAADLVLMAVVTVAFLVQLAALLVPITQAVVAVAAAQADLQQVDLVVLA